MVSALTAVLSWTAFSAAGLAYNMDDTAAASLDPSKMHFSPPWPSSVGPADAEAMRSTANLVVAHMLRSQLLGFALANFLLSIYALWACLTKEMFLGRLTIEESHAALERLVRHVMIKAVFMSAVVDAPDPAELAMWLAWFSVVAYMKCFVGLARDRCQGLMASPSATAGAHLRTLALLCLIVSYDLSWVAACASAFPAASLGQLFLWLHDTALIGIEAGQALASYGVHLADRLRAASAARGKEVAAWEGRGAFLYNVDAGGDIAAQALTLGHLAHIWARAGLSFSLLDLILFMDIRALLAGLRRRLRAFARHRAAARLLQDAYPDAGPAALQGGREQCAICRDGMQSAKVLPCGHLFHAGCLRDWLQTAGQANFTCPICRTSLFATRGGGQAAAVTDTADDGGSRGFSLSAGIGGRASVQLPRQSDCAEGPPLSPLAVAAAVAVSDPGLLREQRGANEASAAALPAATAAKSSAASASGAGSATRQRCTCASNAHMPDASTAAAPAGTAASPAAAAAAAEDRDQPQLNLRLPPPPPLRRSLDQLLPAGALAAQELSAAAAARARAALQDLSARLAAGRTSAAQQAERISAQLRQRLSAAVAAAGEALVDGDNANGAAEPEVTDSGALATRLLDAVLNAGLGVSEFDELLSDEIASAASEDGLSASGGSLRDYQVQLEELRALLWGQALQFVGGSSPRRGFGGAGSGESGDGSRAAAD